MVGGRKRETGGVGEGEGEERFLGFTKTLSEHFKLRFCLKRRCNLTSTTD